jgi:hypothetical protein
MLAGAAQVVITPPVGTFLEGYGARASGSVGVHDDLHARALVVDDGIAQAAIVSCDLIGIDRHTTAAVRALVAAATDIPAPNIIVAATHTHGGPVGMHRHDDQPLRDVQDRLIAGAVIEAWRNKQPCVLKAGRGSVDSVSQNRRDPGTPIDDALRVLLFDAPAHGDAPIASVVNFACHGTVLYHTNMQFSADYPGHALETVRKIVGPTPALFLNGACGDINPSWIEQDHGEAARVGSIVGAEAARRMQELRPLGQSNNAWNTSWNEILPRPVTTGDLIEPRVRVATREVTVRLRDLGAPADYDARIADLDHQLAALSPTDGEARHRLMEQWNFLRGSRTTSAFVRAPNEMRAEIQAIALGRDCAILALPGEFFTETGRKVQEAAGIPHLLIACYANHHLMYVVPRLEFARGGYEPGVSLLDEDAEEAFRAAAIDLLREVTAS